MALKTGGILLVFHIWSVSFAVYKFSNENTATNCGQPSHVIVSPINKTTGPNVNLTCYTNCTLTDNQTYNWYRSGKHLNNNISQEIFVWNSSTHSFSCSVNKQLFLLSPRVCVRSQSCFNVTYTHQRICALKGLTVDLPCTYQYPHRHNLTEANWYIQDKPEGAPKNMSLVPGYGNRVEFVGTKVKDCTLRITDLRESDSVEYKFSFKTQKEDWGFSFPGITLTVTDVQVTSVSEEGNVTLICSTTCTLTDKPTFIWYKNGQRLTNPKILDNLLYLEPFSSEDAGSYSCTVKAGDKEARSPVEKHTPVMKTFVGIKVVGLILVVCLCGFLCFRKKASKSTSDTRDKAGNGQKDSSPMSDNVSSLVMSPTATQTAGSDDQDEVHYANINLSHSKNKDVPLYSTV